METTEIIETKKTDDFKQATLSYIDSLKNRHELVKAEMIKILEATQVLDIQYKEHEKEMYQLEAEYVEAMKSLID